MNPSSQGLIEPDVGRNDGGPVPQVLRALLVEDNPADAEITERMLAAAKIVLSLKTVETGEEALEFLGEAPTGDEAAPVGLILLDLNLPGIDGHEVLAEIRESPRLRDIPVAILSASDAEEDMERAFANFANCYVQKPITGEAFLDIVHAAERLELVAVVKGRRESDDA